VQSNATQNTAELFTSLRHVQVSEFLMQHTHARAHAHTHTSNYSCWAKFRKRLWVIITAGFHRSDALYLTKSTASHHLRKIPALSPTGENCSLVATVRTECGAGSKIKRYCVFLSVCPSMDPEQQTHRCRFAAVGPAGRRYRLRQQWCVADECRECQIVSTCTQNTDLC